MDLITKLRYTGYASTPSLWKNNTVSQFKQIVLGCNSDVIDESIIFKNQRLGKLVEQFVFYQLKQQNTVTWVCDNLQIQNGKKTIGEIDAIYYQKDKPIHLEIVYKFYLYDTKEQYDSPLDYWIGPNRKDRLIYKLDKLNSKQFPLLYNDLTKTYLNKHNLYLENIEQHLCFKAQLFLPFSHKNINISPLNPDCVIGFYISFNKIELFKNFEFYIPTKIDWLIKPHKNVSWINYPTALAAIKTEINNQRSPMVWLKHKKDPIDKSLITWW
jgi:hypothetical protein